MGSEKITVLVMATCFLCITISQAAQLSPESQKIIARIDEDLKGKIGSECDAKLKTLTSLATDESVGKMCELFKTVGKNMVKETCSANEVGMIENTVCKPKTPDTPNTDGAETHNSLSKLGKSVLAEIVKDIDNIKLSKSCMTTGKPTLLAKATNDEYIFGLCDTIVAKKDLVALVCGDDGYNKLKSLVCSKIEEASKHPSSSNATKPSTKLSKSSQQIIARIDKDLEGKITKECDAKLKTLTSMATDQMVSKMCELFKTAGKNMVKDACTVDEVGKIENTLCKSKTPDTPNTDGAETIATVVERIVEKLSILNGTCKQSVPILQQQITNQEILKQFCMNGKTSKGRNYFKKKQFGCTDDDVETIFSTICDEMKSYEAGQSKFEYSDKLSKGANEILQKIYMRSKGHVTNDCQVKAASLYKQLTEDKVYSLCELIQQSKRIVSTFCENNGYEFIKDTICSVLKQNPRPKIIMTAEAKQVMDNVNDTLNQVSQQCADIYKQIQPDGIKNIKDVTDLCSSIEKGKEIFITSCTEDEYSQLKTATCPKSTTHSSLSKLGKSVLDEIVKDIDNIKLSETCMTTGKPALLAKATNDEYIFGLCDTIVAKKSLVVLVCGDDGYNKLKSLVCSKIEEASKHRPSSNATKPSTLSKEAKDTIDNLSKATGVSGSCNDDIVNIIKTATTDAKLNTLCDKIKDTNTTCKPEEHKTAQENVCSKVQSLKDGVNKRRKCIAEKIYQFPEKCNNKVVLPSRDSWKGLNDLCQEVKGSSNKYYKNNCTPSQYDMIYTTICVKCDSRSIVYSSVTIIICVFFSFFRNA